MLETEKNPELGIKSIAMQTKIEQSSEYKSLDRQIKRNIANLIESRKGGIVNGEKMKSTPSDELITQEIEKSESSNLEPAKSVTTQLMDSTPPLRNLRQDAERGIALIDSTANDLHGYMKGLFSNKPEPEVQAYQVDKIEAACMVGKTINELMRTKIKMLNMANELPLGEKTVASKESE